MRHSVPLARGWAEISFGVMFANVTSSTKKLQRGSYRDSGAFPIVDQGEDYIGGYTDNEELVHRAPLPVVVFGDHTRCVKFVDRPFVQGADGVKVLAPNPYADPRYAYWALRHADIPSRGYARHYALLRQLMLPLPPAPEQQRIVEAIESYLTRLDNAVALLERVQENLKRYRASVLKAAVEGRLVPTEAELARREGRSYEPASELLKRILAERKTHWIEDAAEKARAKAAEKARTAGQPWTARDDAATLEKERAKAAKQYKEPAAPDTTDLPELPEGWCWTRIEAVGDVQLGRQRSPKDHHGSHMRPYLRVANVYEDRIDTTDILEMNFTPYEFETYRLRPGDILLNEGQSLELIGRPAMYNGEVPGACFQNTLVRFTSSIAIERRYALMVFLAYMHSGVFQRIARWTTNIAHLGAGRFASLAFPLPPAEEQARIVAEVDRILGSIAAVAGNVQSGTCRAMRLRQSTLKWAFEGKLVEQDPNDEAAEALLERIRAERAAAGADKPRASERRSAE